MGVNDATQLKLPTGFNKNEPASSEKIWALHSSPFQDKVAPTTEKIEGVEGAFMVHGVLTPRECERLVKCTEELGYSSGESLVEVPLEVRGNDVTLLVVDESIAGTLGDRLAPFVPRIGHGGSFLYGQSGFINRRWRCYRYNGPSAFFAPHCP